jgi:hypothetical protein
MNSSPSEGNPLKYIKRQVLDWRPNGTRSISK